MLLWSSISLVQPIRYAHLLRLAENWSTHPLHRVQRLMTHHLSLPPAHLPILMASPSEYIGILNIAVLLYLLNSGKMYLHICFFRRPCSLVNICKSRSQEHWHTEPEHGKSMILFDTRSHLYIIRKGFEEGLHSGRFASESTLPRMWHNKLFLIV